MDKVTFTPTGEFRAPKKGEWFLSRRGKYDWAADDWEIGSDENKRHILKREVERISWKPKEGEKCQILYIDFNGVATKTVLWSDSSSYKDSFLNVFPVHLDLTSRISGMNRTLIDAKKLTK